MTNQTITAAPSKKTVYFLYNGLVQFYPELVFGEVGKKRGYKNYWGGFERTEFLELLFNLTEKDTDIEARNKILEWKRLIDKGEYPSETIPQNINDLVDDLEQAETTKQEDIKIKTAKQIQLQAQRQKEQTPGKIQAARTKPPTMVNDAYPQTTTTSELALMVSPAASRDLGQFTAKALVSPAKILTTLGGNSLYQNNPNLKGPTTAYWAISNGITSGELMRALANAERSGIVIDPLKIKRLAQLLKDQETGHPRLTQLAQLAYNPQISFGELHLTQAELAGLFARGPQAQAYYLLKNTPGDDSYYLPQEYFSLSPLGGLAKSLVGNLASKALNKTIEQAVSTALKAAVVTTQTTAATTVGTAAAAAETAVAAAAAPTGVGLVITLTILAKKIINFIAKQLKKLGSKLAIFLTGEKNKDLRRFAFLGMFLGGLGFIGFGGGGLTQIVGLTSTAIGGTGLLGEGLMNAKGIASGAASFSQSIVYGLTGAVLPAIGVPTVITLVSIPIVIAIFLFIINSGAYMVPPTSSSQFSIDNPYIAVKKTATPKRVDNPPPERTVEYKIEIMAKKGTLTNISFSYECKVMGKTPGAKCPEVTLPTPPDLISPSEDPPYSFTYTVSYSGIVDSIVSDTITVGADALDAPGQVSKGSESVTIGNPPTGCFNVANNAEAWTEPALGNITSAVMNLVGEYTPFVEKVCSGGGIVNLCFDPRVNPEGWAWYSNDNDCTIRFNGGGLNSDKNAIYILTHEAAHYLQDPVDPSLAQDYENKILNPAICSYSKTIGSHNESFAETMALYVELPSFWGAQCGSSSFQELYPDNWQFAHDKVFQ